MTYSDTLLLGFMKNSDAVGLYNAALPIAATISLFGGALLFSYGPIIAGFYGKSMINELIEYYVIITKWTFVASVPILLLTLIFPTELLRLLFGSNYTSASLALQIMCIGSFAVNLLGPNGTTLIVIGKTKFLMWASLLTVVLNIILNIVLIPRLGIVGASIGMTAAISLNSVLRQIKLRRYIKVNPLKKNLMLATGISTGIIIVISFLLKPMIDNKLWILPLLLISFYGIYFIIMLLSRSFHEPDFILISEIASKLRINVIPIKRIIKKYL